jgi:WD40 repeat protein
MSDDDYDDDRPRRSQKKKKKSGKKKSKKQSGSPLLLPAIIGGSIVALAVVGFGVWVLLNSSSPPSAMSTDTTPAYDGPGYTLPTSMLPPKEPVITWNVQDDPPAKLAKEFAPVSLEGKQLVTTMPLGGHHVVLMMPPPTGDIQVFRVLNLKTGETTGEFPQVYGQFRVSDDGARIAAILPVKPPDGAPKNAPAQSVLRVMELESKKQLWEMPAPLNLQWFDFGKTGDQLLFSTSHQYGSTLQYVDLKDPQPSPKPWPLVRARGRDANNLVSVSPGRKTIAINNDLSIELFDLETAKPVGLLNTVGQVLRCVFSGDGKSLLVLTRQQTMERMDPQLVPLTWTTYTLSDGKAVRTISATASMSPTQMKVIQGSDAAILHFETAQGLVHFDLETGANFDTSDYIKPLIPLEADRWVVADERKKDVRVYSIGLDENRKAKLAEVKRLLGERPAMAKVDRTSVTTITANATGFIVPPSPAIKTGPAFNQSESSNVNSEYLDNRADNTTWSAVQQSIEELPRRRAALNWTKFDAATGTPGPGIPLWPCAMEPGRPVPQFGMAGLCVDVNKASNRIALRDPRTASRLDIWNDNGERVIGFEPGAKQEAIEWIGWANEDRLLVRTSASLSGWEGTKAKPVFEFFGSINSVLISPDRTWVAVSSGSGIDVLETQSGKHLGRITQMGKHGTWAGLGVSADGQRLLTASSDAQVVRSTLPEGMVPTEFATWDLATGKQLKSLNVVGRFAASPRTILHELNDKQVLIGSDVLDLELSAMTVSLVPNKLWNLFPNRYIDHRLWMPMGNPRLLLSKKWPDDLSTPVSIKPQDVVFRTGATVKVTTDLVDGQRNQTVQDQFEQALRARGYTIGNGGWTIRIKGTQGASGEKLTTQLGGEINVPYVSGSIDLVAPTGEALQLPGFAGSFGIAKNKYITKSVPTGGGGSITYYDFGGSPSAIMADEVWAEAMGDLSGKVRFPTVVVKQNGKLQALPIPVAFK